MKPGAPSPIVSGANDAALHVHVKSDWRTSGEPWVRSARAIDAYSAQSPEYRMLETAVAMNTIVPNARISLAECLALPHNAGRRLFAKGVPRGGELVKIPLGGQRRGSASDLPAPGHSTVVRDPINTSRRGHHDGAVHCPRESASRRALRQRHFPSCPATIVEAHDIAPVEKCSRAVAHGDGRGGRVRRSDL